jgi:hypothetical protein
VNTEVVIVALSSFAETVTPPILAPAADFTVPVSSMLSGAACAATQIIEANAKDTRATPANFQNVRECLQFIAGSPFFQAYR